MKLKTDIAFVKACDCDPNFHNKMVKILFDINQKPYCYELLDECGPNFGVGTIIKFKSLENFRFATAQPEYLK